MSCESRCYDSWRAKINLADAQLQVDLLACQGAPACEAHAYSTHNQSIQQATREYSECLHDCTGPG